MSIETGIFSKLNGKTPAGERVYPLILPENCTFPALTYQRISTARDNTLDNAADTPHSRFQISCWAETQLEAVALENAVRAALVGFTGLADDTVIQSCTLEDTRDTWEFEISSAGMYRRDLDLEIWFEE